MIQELTYDHLTKLDSKGYLLILLDDKWIREHRYKVERLLNRELTKEEVIHHIDENKLNNDLSNLMLFKNNKEHSRFHRQLRQFGFTNPRKREIENNIIQIKLKELT